MTTEMASKLRGASALVASVTSILLGLTLLGNVAEVGLIYAGMLPLPIGASLRDLAFKMSHSWEWTTLLIGWTLLAGAVGTLALALVRRDPARRLRGTLAGTADRFGKVGLAAALVDTSVVIAFLAYGRLAYWWL